ncbi:hypothetical protein GEV43_39985 [Actinomadura sp. J1-007]|uniref:hypothetical protein n=1 Tax=Actinomadura sp. J1-007 TaxID=2661913 RepID=UPI001326800D|nr:hypothetical protein [Actinomadura sp. J1-007]MWK39577.1 hypothetical protein [Actinomadura sp. J1-007]
MRKLITHVHVADDVGQVHVFGPGDTVPTWATKKITNPDVWDTPPDTERADGPGASPAGGTLEDPRGGQGPDDSGDPGTAGARAGWRCRR